MPHIEPDIQIVKIKVYRDCKSDILGFCDLIVNGLAIKGVMIASEIVNQCMTIDLRFPNKKMKNGSFKKIVYPVFPELYFAIKNTVIIAYLKEVENHGADCKPDL